MITVSKEDYLKAIAEAEAEGETVISATLAHWLAVTRPAVTAALKRLKKDRHGHGQERRPHSAHLRRHDRSPSRPSFAIS